MSLSHEEPPKHLDSQFAIACHDELVDCKMEVLREVALVVMTGGSFRSLSMSAPFSTHRSGRELTSKPPRRRRRHDPASLPYLSRASNDRMMRSLDTEADETRWPIDGRRYERRDDFITVRRLR